LKTATDPLVEVLFGRKNYHYRLELDGEKPEVVYKERNFTISVLLIDKEREKVINCKYLVTQQTWCTFVSESATPTESG
jgi:hypothetical protein